jgi:hypothetical protein
MERLSSRMETTRPKRLSFFSGIFSINLTPKK